MDDKTQEPAFSVHRVTIGGLIPLARYYNCIRCDQELTDWVLKQSPAESSACPNCEARIDERDIAQAQRDTRLGCVWTLVGVASVLLVTIALVGIIWLFAGPQPLIRFR
jgi:DNA-directed RNA polymerase subunit RPC12/RpoP